MADPAPPTETPGEAQVWVATVVIYCPACPNLIPESEGEIVERNRWGEEVSRRKIAYDIWSPESTPARVTCPYCGWEGPVAGSFND